MVAGRSASLAIYEEESSFAVRTAYNDILCLVGKDRILVQIAQKT